ncbi:tyrosine-type recombinase/integrase [Clostridium butyricum]|uniref:tyrosine-type recombinase/integrase n=1 Tax=Clostridium butyricum TaxID=1492 RepID=UPI0024B902F6|nr:tyrosine-type recombinase/integrase [Clostridium butyricum]
MAPINKIYNLIGISDEDWWDLASCGITFIENILKEKITQYRYIDFSGIMNEDIKKEMKYYIYYFLSDYNQCLDNLRSDIRTLIWFINYLVHLKDTLLEMESLSSIEDDFCTDYVAYLNAHNVCTTYRKNYVEPVKCRNKVARIPIRIRNVLIDEYNKVFNREPDIWYVKDFNLALHRINLSRDLKAFRFYGVYNLANKEKFKQYIKHLLINTEISISFIVSKFVAVKYFMKFLGSKNIEDVNRHDIEEYKQILLDRNIEDNTYNARLFGLSDFFEYCISIGVIDYNHIYIEYDTLKSEMKVKCDIVEKHVIEQILNHSSDIPENYFLMFLILYCCGMRISEVCILKTICLKKDENGYYIVFYMQKMKKEVSNPIPENLYYRNLDYQKTVIERYGNEQKYLFTKDDGLPVLANTYKDKMQDIIKKFDIRNSDGSIYIFRPHEYRHTFATNLVEKDIPFCVIQKLLHHSSPEMSLVYTMLSDSRKRRKYVEFINIVGQKSTTLFENEEEAEKVYEVQWLKKNLKSQALPNGFCSLPVSLGQCPHANECLMCEHFKTTAGHLNILKKQLQRTNELISIFRERNLEKQLSLNIKVKENLEKLINSIEEGDNSESSV